MKKQGSLNKLRVWEKNKQAILSKMDKGLIEPEKADKILNFIKLTLKKVTTLEDLGSYCGMLAKRFPELKETIKNLKLEEEEKLENAISLVVDKLMQTGHIEEAGNLMRELDKTKSINSKLKTVKTLYSKEFEEAYKEIFDQK